MVLPQSSPAAHSYGSTSFLSERLGVLCWLMGCPVGDPRVLMNVICSSDWKPGTLC